MINIALRTLATLTVLADLIIATVLILWLSNCLGRTRKLLAPYQYTSLFLITLIATLGSLFFSEVAHYTPCILCWYQRIAMYPQPFLLYTAIIRKETVLKPYLLVMNTVGALIALYHTLIMYFPRSQFFNCEVGGAISCTKKFFLYYGYISIPVMALSAFVLNIVILALLSRKERAT